MSDVENVDIMLGNYSRGDERNDQSDSELNLDSGSIRPQQNSNLVGEYFRSLLNTNSRDNSESTRMISEEIPNQMSGKLNEIKSSLNSQIQDAITTAITEKCASF